MCAGDRGDHGPVRASGCQDVGGGESQVEWADDALTPRQEEWLNRYTERGFRLYGELMDSYGNDIRVQESSAANGPHVWIFIDAGGDLCPHLNVAQAIEVRDALSLFIAEHSPGETNVDAAHLPGGPPGPGETETGSAPQAPPDTAAVAVSVPDGAGSPGRVTARVQVFQPGCGLPGCRHHYDGNAAKLGCICPAWFDGGGYHLVDVNPSCTMHDVPGEERETGQ